MYVIYYIDSDSTSSPPLLHSAFSNVIILNVSGLILALSEIFILEQVLNNLSTELVELGEHNTI